MKNSTGAVQDQVTQDLNTSINQMAELAAKCRDLENNRDNFDKDKAKHDMKEIRKGIEKIVDLLTNRVVDKEEAARLAQEKIDKSNKKLEEMKSRLKEMNLDIDWDKIEPEKKELIELILLTIRDSKLLVDLNIDIMSSITEGDTHIKTQLLQSTLNNHFSDALEVYLQATQYFIKALSQSQSMLLNGTKTNIMASVTVRKYKTFVKLNAPQSYAEHQKLSNDIFANLIRCEEILKTKTFKQSGDEQASFKNILDKFRIQINLNESEKNISDIEKNRK